MRLTGSLLQATLDATSDGILVVDLAGRIVIFNRRFTDLWRIPEDVLASGDDQRALAFVLDQLAEPDAFLARVKQLYAAPEASSFDVIRFRDGRTFERTSLPQRVGSEVVGRVWSFRDVTDHVRAEEALRELAESEDRFRAVAEATFEGIGFQERGIFRHVSAAFEQMFGYGPGEAVGRPIFEIIAPEDRDRARADVGRNTARQYTGLRRDGSRFPIEIRAGDSVLGGRPLRVGAIRDLSEHAAALEALTASEQRLRSITVTSPDGIVTADASGGITGWNPAAAGLFGYADDEILGRPLTDLIPDSPSAGCGGTVERTGRRRDGSTFPCEVSLGSWGEGDRRELGAIVRDVTERHRMQAHVAATERLATVGTLAAGVAHEINTPLSAVLANVLLGIDLLAREAPLSRSVQGEVRDLLVDARTGAERVRNVVRDLRIFARDDAADAAVVDLRAVVESAVHLASNEVRHRARLVKEFRAPAFVLGNESRLCQVVLHLLVDAAQAIPEGAADRHEVRIAIGRDDEGRCVIEVSDTGSGISDDVRPRLFEPFVASRPGVAAGLGLAICHRIVTDHGGAIAVDSSSAGSTFRVVLPSAPAPTAAEAPRASGDAAGPRGRLLVIDDDPLVLRLLVRMLGNEHGVTATTSATQALEAIGRGEAFDLVLCDLMMPEVSGIEFYERLVRIDPALAGRIVFVTGGAFTPAARAFLAGTRHLVVDKPFDVQALRVLIRDALRPSTSVRAAT